MSKTVTVEKKDEMDEVSNKLWENIKKNDLRNTLMDEEMEDNENIDLQSFWNFELEISERDFLKVL